MSRFYYIGTVKDEFGRDKRLYIDVKRKKLTVYSLNEYNVPKTEIDIEKNYKSDSINMGEVKKLVAKNYRKRKQTRNSPVDYILIILMLLLLGCTIFPVYDTISEKKIEKELEEEMKKTGLSAKQVATKRIEKAINDLAIESPEEQEELLNSFMNYFNSNYQYYDEKSLLSLINNLEEITIEYRDETVHKDGDSVVGGLCAHANPTNGYKNQIILYNEEAIFHEVFHAIQGSKHGYMLDELSSYSADLKYNKDADTYRHLDDLLVLREIIGKEKFMQCIVQRRPKDIYEELAKLSGESKENIEKFFKEYDSWYNRSYTDNAEREKNYIPTRESMIKIIKSIDDNTICDNFIIRNYISKEYESINNSIFDEEMFYVKQNTKDTAHPVIIMVTEETKNWPVGKILNSNGSYYLNKLYKGHILGTLSEADENHLNMIMSICDPEIRKNINIDNFAEEVLKGLEKYNYEEYDLNVMLNCLNMTNSVEKEQASISTNGVLKLYSMYINKLIKKLQNYERLSLAEIADLKIYQKYLRSNYDDFSGKDISATYSLLNNFEQDMPMEEFTLYANSNLEWINKNVLEYAGNEVTDLDDLEIRKQAPADIIFKDGNMYLFYNATTLKAFPTIYIKSRLEIHSYTGDVTDYTAETFSIGDQMYYGFLVPYDPSNQEIESAEYVWKIAEKDTKKLKKYIQIED